MKKTLLLTGLVVVVACAGIVTGQDYQTSPKPNQMSDPREALSRGETYVGRDDPVAVMRFGNVAQAHDVLPIAAADVADADATKVQLRATEIKRVPPSRRKHRHGSRRNRPCPGR